MKNKKIISFASSLILIVAGASCNHKDDHVGHVHGHGHEHESHHHSHEAHQHTHEHQGLDVDDEHVNENLQHKGIIEIEPEDAQSMGIVASEVKPGSFTDACHVSGIVESSPTDVYTATSKSRGIVRLSPTLTMGNTVRQGAEIASVNGSGLTGGDDNIIAYNEMLTAQREYERLKPLYDDGIVSARDYNAAEAAYRAAKAAYAGSTSGSKITSGVNGTINEIFVSDGDYVEAGSPIARISKQEKLVLRVDLPTRLSGSVKNQNGGIIKFVGQDTEYTFDQLQARRQSDRASNTVGAYIPLYYSINNNGNLVPGMVADIYLEANEKHGVISVPLTAVSEQQGVNFVYIKLDEDCYKKQAVELGASNGKYVEIKRGLEPGQDVVTEGMIFVKLAESNGAVPEGHSHTH